MANVFDVATYIVQQLGEMSAVKLQKLVYYSQAWSLVWDECQLFPEEIQAWAAGPVAPALYERHRGQFRVTAEMLRGGNLASLTTDQRETVDAVTEFYGPKTGRWLSDLTHAESPWRDARARADASPGEFCREVITLADMAEYYSGLTDDGSTTESV